MFCEHKRTNLRSTRNNVHGLPFAVALEMFTVLLCLANLVCMSTASNDLSLSASISISGFDFISERIADELFRKLNGFRLSEDYRSRYFFNLFEISVSDLEIIRISKPQIQIRSYQSYDGLSVKLNLAEFRAKAEFDSTFSQGQANLDALGTELWLNLIPFRSETGKPLFLVKNYMRNMDTFETSTDSNLVGAVSWLLGYDAKQKLLDAMGDYIFKSPWNPVLEKLEYSFNFNWSSPFVTLANLPVTDFQLATHPMTTDTFMSFDLTAKIPGLETQIPQQRREPVQVADPSAMFKLAVPKSTIQNILDHIWANQLLKLKAEVDNEEIPNFFVRWLRKMTCSGCVIRTELLPTDIPVVEFVSNCFEDFGNCSCVELKSSAVLSLTQTSGDKTQNWGTIRPTLAVKVRPWFTQLGLFTFDMVVTRIDITVTWEGEGGWSKAFKMFATKLGLRDLKTFFVEKTEEIFAPVGELVDVSKFIGEGIPLTFPGLGLGLNNSSVMFEGNAISIESDVKSV